MKRRDFITKAGMGAAAVVAGSSLAAPAVAQGTKTMTIVTTWPRDFPGLGLSGNDLRRELLKYQMAPFRPNTLQPVKE